MNGKDPDFLGIISLDQQTQQAQFNFLLKSKYFFRNFNLKSNKTEQFC